ncbi:MAG: polyphosphate kinase 1 [Lawsonibacter sp.]|nr:polyphosphate kinase 1 [Lawsonibacter sp.]
MKEKEISSASSCYVNRELSWLQFNQRVLEEADDPENPLLERLNFASIFQSNLDEFYMVRVGVLLDTLENGVTDDKTGMTSAEQLSAVLDRTRGLLGQRDRVYQGLMGELAAYGVELCSFHSLPDKTKNLLEKYFHTDVLPLLSPQIIGRKQPFPFLRNKSTYAVAMLRTKSGGERMGIVPCGEGALRRLVPLPGEGLRFVLVEDLIAGLLSKIFVHYKVEGSVLIRLVRSADIHVDEADGEGDGMHAEAYRRSMETLVRRRRRLNPVKLEYRGKLEENIRSSLCRCLDLSKKHLFASGIPLDLSFTGALRDMLRDKGELFYPRRVPQPSPNVDLTRSVIDQIRRRDILLRYPYESVRPLLRLLQEAGHDPEVVSIKMTLYRVAHNSKVVEALVDAAENGKEVVVLVELRARFDEENNIGWSRVLEQAGCRVIYGLDGLKVHSKLLLITRSHQGQVEYITQVGTGNYNEDTVRLYTDYALMTAAHDLGADAARVFNSLSMEEVVEEPGPLLVAPVCLRAQILKRMDEEIERARAGQSAYLGFKLNGLTDKVLADKLLEASQAGVQVDLLVRGICCLVGGVPGLSDHIRVGSLVGRFLEHARIYLFGTQERRQVYLSSADFMTRNTTHRVEVAIPVRDEDLRDQLEEMFFDQFRDTAKLRLQQPDGAYIRARGEGSLFNAQEAFYDRAYQRVWALPAPQRPEPLPAQDARPAMASAALPKTSRPKPASVKPAPTKPVKRPGLLSRLKRKR